MYQIETISQSSENIITLQEAKDNQKIDYTDEDSNLQLLVDGVHDFIESYTGRILRQKDVVIHAENWSKSMVLPVGTISAITDVKYRDPDGVEQTLQVQDYKLCKYDGFVRVLLIKTDDYPSLSSDEPYPISITATAGYTSANMPKDLKNAALLLFGNAEQYREDMPMNGNRTAERLLRNYRKH